MFQLSSKQITYVKISFNVVFISIVLLQFLQAVFHFLPDSTLFFFTSDAFEYAIFLCLAYLLYFRILPLEKNSLKIFSVLCCLAITIFLAGLKSYRISQTPFSERTFDFVMEFVGKTFLFYALLYFVYKMDFLNTYKKMQNELVITKRQLLKNQLHPHFLFNAFNSLYSLSLKNSPKTSDTILKLADMMRYLTDDVLHTRVKLSQEIQFIKEYIALEKIRFGDDANINFNCKGDVQSKTIEPLLFIPLVENAFKHGFYTNNSNAFINININIDVKSIVFNVENNIQKQQHFNTNNRKGKGLENLKKRLQLSYPKQHKLKLEKNDDTFLTELKLFV